MVGSSSWLGHSPFMAGIKGSNPLPTTCQDLYLKYNQGSVNCNS